MGTVEVLISAYLLHLFIAQKGDHKSGQYSWKLLNIGFMHLLTCIKSDTIGPGSVYL